MLNVIFSMRFSLFNRKVVLFFLSVFVLCSALLAEKTEVIKTKYFDIIYPLSSKVAATLIATHADEYAQEISDRLKKKIPHRYPVYISSKYEVLNGYYTLFPYQRIVIYDATIEDGDLGNEYDAILNVFYHELTHAISLWYYLPTLSLSFDEGVAVLFESRKDQGRLNDPLIAHHIMQNKIDKTTPTWREASGHRDVYPGAFWAYIYGANFLAYLEKVYGKTEYIKFFSSNFFIFPKEKTKHIFKKSLEELWSDFTSSIQYPQNITKPVSFDKTKMQNAIIAQSKNGFACYDGAKKTVYFYNHNNAKKKLFSSPSNITDLNFSPDGFSLLVSDVKYDWGKLKQCLSVYDMEKGKFLEKRLFSIRYATFVNDNLICAVKVERQNSHFVLLNKDLEEIETLLEFGPGLAYSHIYSPVYAGKDIVAFIAANGQYRDILLFNIKTKELSKLQTKEKLTFIRYLKSSVIDDKVLLTFSWCGKDMLYRMALYDIEENKLKTLDEDISGGTFQPIAFKKDREDMDIVYIGIHGKYDTLYKTRQAMLKEKEVMLDVFNMENVAPISEAPNFEGIKSFKYNYFSYLWRVLPLPYVKPSYDFKNISEWGFGTYLYGKDPTEFVEFNVTPLLYFKPFFMEMNINTFLDFTSFKLGFSLSDQNHSFVARSTSFSVSASSGFALDQINKRFSFGGLAKIVGIAKIPANYFQNKTLYSYGYTNSLFAISLYGRYSQFETRYRLLSPFFAIDSRGFSASIKTDYILHMQSKNSAFILQGKGNFSLPIVPIKMSLSTYYSYNAYYRPNIGAFFFLGSNALIQTLSYLPSMEEYKDVSKTLFIAKNNLGASFNVSAALLSYEIQKGSNLFLIYLNRINFEVGYYSVLNIALGGSNNVKASYFHSIYGNLYLDISGMVKIGLRYSHPIEKGVSLGKFSLIFDADIFF